MHLPSFVIMAISLQSLEIASSSSGRTVISHRKWLMLQSMPAMLSRSRQNGELRATCKSLRKRRIESYMELCETVKSSMAGCEHFTLLSAYRIQASRVIQSIALHFRYRPRRDNAPVIACRRKSIGWKVVVHYYIGIAPFFSSDTTDIMPDDQHDKEVATFLISDITFQKVSTLEVFSNLPVRNITKMPANKSAFAAVESSTGQELTLRFNAETIKHADYVPKAKAQQAPQLIFSSAKPDQTYLVVALDLDAPFVNIPVLGPILHWIQPGLKASADSILSKSEPFVADYIGPAPPPPSGPHRYSFFLYEQPEDFDGKKYAPPSGAKLPAIKRMRYDLDAFQKEAGLGKIVGCTYFKSN
ncbi:Protein D1 [Pseudocercospora fuligena]|uniref:Protein D1 n=1 Tax=Pseudocercospora fuligena TaxID=685502 RepID=A0A8H6RHY3_9PEZI|nr:Protein D1 [Pseudocercospora fuligena]